MYPADNLVELIAEDAGTITYEKINKVLVNHCAGIQVLLGPQIGEGYVDITPESATQLIDSLRGQADFTVFDLPSQPTEAVQTVLRKCDIVVVVLEREPSSVKAATVLLDLLKSRGIGGGTVVAVTVTRSPVSSPVTADYLQKNLDCRLVAMIPPDADGCAAAMRSRALVTKARPESMCSAALKAMSKKLVEDRVPALTF
jgi:MinD-like ATPase involved in chromosome partitioning or flagellar assembly